jgi:hypothetical protein
MVSLLMPSTAQHRGTARQRFPACGLEGALRDLLESLLLIVSVQDFNPRPNDYWRS